MSHRLYGGLRWDPLFEHYRETELMKKPYSHINADVMILELHELTDTEKMIEEYKKFVRSILESDDIIYGN